ncbi:MAG: HEAT repeat domain-containing protein [Deltaproteobacteria bacterium]|nr:HEAT repeat domain-containing protein [Deltaproteobacteria bacterium]
MSTRKYFHIISTIAVILTFLLTSLAWGKPGKINRKKAAVKPAASEIEQNIDVDTEFQAFVADLQSTDPEKVVVAIQMLGATGNPAACSEIIALLKTGPGNDITNLALQTLGVLGNPDAINTLVEYLNHRRSDARVIAILALEGYSSPKIKHALEQKLRDSDPQVRTNAAIALVTKGDASSVPILFKAFNRGVNDAAVAIGRLGARDDALRLTEYLGKLDISVLLPGFREFLTGSHLDDDMKLQVLNVLFDFAGPEVRQFAVEMRAKIKAANPEMEYDDPILKLLSKMVNQIVQD